MSAAPVTTDSAAILGEAWPDNAVETASEQLDQVQQLAGVMTREAEARATVASAIRSVAESEGFEIGHSARDARVAAYTAQAEIAQGALTQAWWAILGYSRALEGTLTAIVYAYQPRLDAARTLAATEPAAGAAAYTEALTEAIAEREAALAAATSGISAQLSVLASLATQASAPASGSGGSTLGLFRDAAGGQDSAASSGIGAAAGVAAGATLAALRGEAGPSTSGTAAGAASGDTLSDFRGAASQGSGTSGAALDAKGGGAVLDSFQGEAAAQGPVVGSSSPIASGSSQSAAGRAGGAGAEIAGQAGGAGADATGQAGTSVDAATSVAADSSGNMSVVLDAGAEASSAGTSSGSSSVSPQASVSGDITASTGSLTSSSAATAGLAGSAGAQVAASQPTAPLAGNPPAAPMPSVAPVAPAGSALAGGGAQGVSPTVSTPSGPAVRTPGLNVSAYSPGASSFAVPSAAAAGPGAAAAASGVAAGAVGGAAAGAVHPAAPEAVLSPDLRRALATVAALADAGAGRVGWAVAVLARPDGARQYLFASTLAGGYIPRGVYPYAELGLAFPPPVAPADVLGLADPAVALVEYQKLVFPDWQLTAVASSLPVAGIRDLVDPEVTQSKQVSTEDLVLSPMRELGPRTVHRLDLVSPGGFEVAMAVARPAHEFFAAAWQAHEANASGPGARARCAVLDDLMASREPMPATWDDLRSDHAAHEAALFGWGAVTEANAADYLAAFTDLMASETLLIGRGGSVTCDDLADALYSARLALRAQTKVLIC